MFRASLAAAALALGTLSAVAPAPAAPPPSGVIPAQWRGGRPPSTPADCWRLLRQLQDLLRARYRVPPWEQARIRSEIRRTRLQLRYRCPGF